MNINTDEMLQSYGLDSPFPQQWKDSKYSSALATLGNETAATDDNGSALIDELLSALSINRTVASDEPDPLGSGRSIMELIQQRSRRTPTSSTERGVFLPSSTSFDPRKFLREVYGSASLAELERGLDSLKRAMAGNESGLRKMVDSDYESYVTSKRKLDEVMNQLHRIGVNEGTDFGMEELNQKLSDATNQLTVRARPLDDVCAEHQRLENALRSLEMHRSILELPQTLEKHLETGGHDQFLRDYKRETRVLRAMMDQSASAEEQKLAAMIASRAQAILHKYREQIYAQLMRTPVDGSYAPLLAKLIDLGAGGNPAFEWLEHNFKRFAGEIEETFESLKQTAATNLAESLESGKKLDMVTYFRNMLQSANSFPPSVDEVAELLDAREAVVDAECDHQWKHVLSAFEKLRLILSRAVAFYRDFVSLSSDSMNRSSNLRLSESEISMFSRRCRELIAMTGEKLVESLTARSSDAMPLPIAAANARDSDTHRALESTELLAFLPLHTNSLATAKYLGRILEILGAVLNQVSELLPPQAANPLSDNISVVKQQFVKTLCEGWTQDSIYLGKIQEWNSSTYSRFPEYFTAYHGLMIEKLRYLLDSGRGGPASPAVVDHINKVFPAALSLSIRSIEEALVESSRAGISDAQSVVIDAQLQPASLGQDAKLLVTLSNLEMLKQVSLENLYDQFESMFKQQHHIKLVRAEVTPEIEKISSQLFDIYIRKKRSRLSQIVHQETQRLLPSWRDTSESSALEVRRVSNYIYECLMVLVETHSLCNERCPQITRRAVLELYKNLLTSVLDVLRDTDTLSRYGTLQNITDLEFMRWAMSQFPETTSICQQIFDAIRRASVDDNIWTHKDGPRGLVIGVLDDAVRQSHFAFYSFKSLAKPN